MPLHEGGPVHMLRTTFSTTPPSLSIPASSRKQGRCHSQLNSLLLDGLTLFIQLLTSMDSRPSQGRPWQRSRSMGACRANSATICTLLRGEGGMRGLSCMHIL